MNSMDFILRLNALGASLSLDGDNLLIKAPRGVLSPELREELKAHKADIHEILRRKALHQGSAGARPEPGAARITRAPRKGDLPLSFAQQRLWFLDQLEPDNAFYTIPVALHLEGPLDVGALERSLQEIVRRHEALRTTFPAAGGQAQQRIAEGLNLPLPVVEVQAGPDEVQDAEVRRLAEEEARRPFSLAEGPLLRVTLLRRSERSHVLLLMMHHIISDGWSMGVLVRELRALYLAFVAGRPSPLPELPIQYADYAASQRQWLQGEVLEAQLAYWKQELAGAPPALELPTDRPRPAMQTYRGATCPVHLPRALSDALVSLSRQQGATLFMTLLAAFQALLSRYTGQDDIVVGSPMAGRTRTETETLIGFFVNTLPLRADLSGDPPFRELVGRVREVTLRAHAHQDVPFERLVDEFQPERDPSRSPLFQAMFALQNMAIPELALGEIRLSLEEIDGGTAKFDLTLFLRETEEGIRGRLEYNTDLFDRATIERMAGHYRTLLEGAVEAPERRVSELPILTVEERRLLLGEWNDTRTDYPADRCIHELFEVQAEQTPDAVAVVFGEQRLTYGELNGRANHLARHLRSLGVGPDVLVGLCAERSAEMVVGMLGILKAGGAYVPLDPSYPGERLALMLEDTGAPVLLTQERLLDRLPELPVRKLCLDAAREAIAAESDEAPRSEAGPDSLAYVIYTSGSTGTPKGVAVTHRAIARLVCTTDYVSLQASDVIAQASTCSFDAATFEIWGALLHGARLVGLGKEVMLSSAELARRIAEDGITALFITTALFNQVAREAPSAFARLDCLLFGGEAADPQRVRAVLQAGSPRRLLHVYGPTETTTFATWHQVADVPEGATTVPIGRPIANTRAYVLDPRRQMVPPGVVGELYIGGPGVARGYLNRPELTEERFLPDPFSGEPGARMYRTGDLCRWLPGGVLEFVGRTDHQVKIRGFRIELGEIESALGQHLSVRDVVVLAREDSPADKRLVAYLVPKEAPLPADGELRSYLQRSLPEHMIPTAFVGLPELPLSPNGKVDRKALPAPAGQRPEQGQAFVAPRTSAEAALARVWAEVLRLDHVGVFDNFFALGGDSILAIQVISKAQQAGLSLSVRQFFQHQTIASLADVAVAAPSPSVEQGPIAGPVPLTPIQRWFFEQERVSPHHFNQAMLLEVLERIDLAALEQAVQYLVRHHDALRLRFAREGGAIRQFNEAADEAVTVTAVDLSAVPAGGLSAAIEEAAAEVQGSLCLETGPLARVALLDLGPERPSRLLIVIHHLAVDGVSWRILLEDLEAAYTQVRRGEAPRLPPKTTSFQRWAEQLSAYAQSEGVRAELPCWRSLPEAPPLPVDIEEGGDNTVASARTVEVTLGVEETRALLQEVPEVYRTQINDVLLLALAQAFAPWTGAPRLRIDLEGHGREEIAPDLDLSRTVGWFTTLYPVVLELPDAPLGEAIKSVKEQVRRIPSRGLGYGLLRYLQEDPATRAELAAAPRSEVSFNYLGQLDQMVAASSLFGFAGEPSGSAHSPDGARTHAIDVLGWVAGARLHVAWTYSEVIHRRATVEGLAERFMAALQAVLAHCRSAEAGGRTPSDFPLARLTQAQVDRLAGTGRQVEDIYPLSPMQQGMLFHSLRDPSSGVYVEQISFRVPSGLVVPAFKDAWSQVLDRHPILRSAFVWGDVQEPLQIVRKGAALRWVEEDWRGTPAGERGARLSAFLEEDRSRGFDFSAAPLVRLALLRLTDETYQFVWSFHHLLLDGWSLPVVLRDVLGYYQAACACQGNAGRLPAPPPYRDYIAWLMRQDMGRAEAFWREALRGFSAPTPLPVSRSGGRTSAGGAAYATQELRLSAATTGALERFARAHGLTLNTVLQGAWGLLLSRYSGEDDVVFGATTSGRSAGVPGVESMVGLFINTLPVRVQTASDTPVVPWLRALQERQAEQLPYAHSPLAQVQGFSEVPRGQALFESLLVVENYPINEALHQGNGPLAIEDIRAVEQTNYPLTVVVVPGSEGLLRISHATEQLDEATVERMLAHYQALLQGIVEAPERRVSELSLPTAEERHELLVAWNDTAADYPRDRCVHELFEAQVERTPHAVAAVFEGEELSYRELNARANRLAHALRDRGVGLEAVVALLMPRGIELLTSILAIFKAGGAYLPLDPEHPAERLLQVLRQSGAALVVATGGLLDTLRGVLSSAPLERAPEVLPFGELLERGCGDEDLRVRSTPGALAYVIYTSGSTGVPKGAMVEQRGMVNHLYAKIRGLDLGPGDVLAQNASQCFDISVWQLLAALLVGGRVHIFPPEVAGDPERLFGAVASGGVTILEVVPSLLRIRIEQLASARGRLPALPALRWLILTGEALPPELCRAWFTLYPTIPLLNAYGPTECSDDVTHHPMASPPGAEEVYTPIGRPIQNTQLYVLDRRMQLVPIGVAGELFVGGDGVGRGYLNDPARTREVFVPDPFSAAAGARLYRTGDLCRFRPDGSLEYLGRLDHQVKIRGFRIELGEIESALAQHPAVREVVVMAREDSPGDKRLVAYLVAREAPLPGVSELRSHLKARLPEYMIPAAFVELPALPLSPNGKIDRKALPAPDAGRPEQERAFAAPRTGTEEALARVWAEVLRLDRVGVFDSFFALGGDSILAIQIISKAQQAGLGLSVRQIFEHQTIAELAAVAAEAAGTGADQGPASGPVELTPIQRWFFEAWRVDPHHYNQAMLLEPRERLDLAALERAVQHLVQHHDALRLRFARARALEGAEVRQQNAGIEEAAPVTTVDLSAVPAAEQAVAIEQAAAEVQGSLCLESGPLARVAVLDLGPERPSRLLIVIHHLAVDGVSWQILLEDLEAAYTQARRGEALRLPPKTTSFQRWAERLSAYAQSDAVREELSYWRSLPEAPPLPVDREGGDNTVASTRTVEVDLGVEETRALLQDVPEVYRTQINDVLLLALVQAFVPWTGARRLRIDLEGHGREEIAPDLDLSRTVGWFTTMFPVVLELPEAPLGEAIKSVKEQMRRTPSRGLGYGLLRYLHEDEAIREELAAAPQAEVSFNYLGQLDAIVAASTLLQFARESSGPALSPRAVRTHRLDINGWVAEGRLRLMWAYSEELYRRATVEGLAQRFLSALQAVVAHCRSAGAGGRTPSDFLLAKLTQAQVDRLAGRGREVEDIYPLSPMQQGMLFHTLRDPSSGVYVQQISFRIAGGLVVPAFRAAWSQVLQRHPALRSAFVWGGLDEPLQVVRTGVALPWAEEDWRDVPAGEQDARLSALLEQDRARGFDLAAAPLMRLTLLRLGDEVYQVVWSFHHLLTDGWSLPILFKDLLGLYEAARQGKAVHLPVPRPYRDYIAWLMRQDRRRAEAFWREALQGFHAPTPLPVSAPSRGAAPETAAPALQELRLPEATTQALERFARAHGLTLNTVLQGAWGLLLSRYSGEEDVVFGATTSGRSMDLAGIEAMVGLFINTLPVRVQAAPESTVVPWLRDLQERQATQLSYAHSPLADVQGWSEVPRGQALFESLLVVENYPVDEELRQERRPLGIEDVRPIEQTNYPLTIAAVPGREMALRLSYAAGRFDDVAIARILVHYRTLLEGMVEAPERRLSELPMLTAEERQEVVVRWNDTRTDYPADCCIHELFEEQAERTPGAVAVVFGEQRLTYRELNDRANQLAHHLRSLGVGPEVLVGVCVERSVEMVVGMLGILKAGGAYVPLDPTYPRERLAFMLEDAGAAVLLTQERLLDSLPEQGARRLCLDAGWDAVARESVEDPRRTAGPRNLAYVIYTSGSTGKPKGVAIEHHSTVAMLAWARGAYTAEELRGVLFSTSICFDLSVFELFAPLCAGGKVILAANALELPSLPRSAEVTLVNTVPTAIAQLARDRGIPASVRVVNLAGEALSSSLVQQVYASQPSIERVFNLYGPTEDTTYSTWALMEKGSAEPVTIGRPMPNGRAYVLDARMQPVPVGVAAELYLGGEGLARGYLNRPELTEQRFVPDPISGEPGERLYRTGDLCRWRQDGTLEYLGRIDSQVKIRGFRIELGEIESALGQHPSVREAVVVAREDSPGDKRLVAYLVAGEGPLPGMAELRRHLQATLPDYMLPAAFVELPVLPLLPNGKVNRRALPAPDGQRPEQGQAFVAPRTQVEEALAETWAETLRLDRVGVFDSFFALGGDSILAIQVISKAQRAGLSISVRQLYQHHTIAALAAVADREASPLAEQGAVVGPVALTPIQRWFFDQDPADPHHFNQAVLLEVRERLDLGALEQAVKHLVQHHDALRLRFAREGSSVRQSNACADETVMVTAVDLSSVPASAQAKAIERAAAEVQGSLCLEAGPLMRVAVMDLGAERPGRLLVVIHHLAVDGVSWRILLEDLQTAYTQVRRGEVPRLPPKTTSFQRWAERLSAYAQAEIVRQELSYWRSLPEASPLPVDSEGGANTVASARVVEVDLGAEETRALLQDVPEVYRTQINDVLLLALAQALVPWTGGQRLRIDLEGHGREEIAPDLDVSRTVGWFTALFPVALELPDAPLGEAIKSVKEQLRRIPKRGLGHGLLRYLQEDPAIGAELAAAPQAEVSFNYLGQLDQSVSASSLFRLARESSGPAQSPRAARSHRLEVDGLVADGRLRVVWTYSENLHRRATIEALARRFLLALQGIVAHCRSAEAGGRTSSDFPLAKLTQAEVDRLAGRGREVEDIYPLSPMQQGMLFHSLRDPTSGVYVQQVTFRIPSGLVVAAFKEAWSQVLQRHPVLRSAFVWEGLAEPLQIVRPRAALPWVEQDWRDLPAEEREARLGAFLAEDRTRGFELAAAPLARVALLRLTDEAYQVVWSFHHLLLDGWSLPVFFTELIGFYDAASRGKAVSLPSPRPYGDYIAWLKQQDIARAEAFWREALRGFSAPTPLPVSLPPGGATAGAAAAPLLERRLPAATTAALERFARAHGLTLNTVLQGAWALLLHRYSGEEDVVFGATTSGRPADLPGIEAMVGLFINTLPVRVQAAPEATIVPWLEQLQARQVEQLSYAYSPLAEVQGWSEVPRGQPLFESLLVVENYPVGDSLRQEGGPLHVIDARMVEQTSYPLTVMATPGSELALRVSYAAERFDEATIARLLGHYQALLEGMVEAPGRRVSEVPMLTAEERHHLLFAWNDTKADYPAERCVHELFEAQVERTPEAEALVFGEQRLSYRALNDKANHLAHHLRSLGVGPEALVGLCVERSVEMVVGMLGILKAGGAYVPLDPSYPRERLAFMLEDAGASVLLTQERLLDSLPEHGARRLCLDTGWEAISRESAENPRRAAGPGNLAYVIYTSGSTGKPKGVAIEHHSTVAMLAWAQGAYTAEQLRGVLFATSICFDLSVFELFAPLCAGGKVILAANALELPSLPHAAEVTLVNTVPTAIAQLARDGGIPSSVRVVNLAGEALSNSLVQQVYAAQPSIERVFNLYGPTEDTTYSTWALVEKGSVEPVTIGRAMPNGRAYVLDARMQPVPVGVAAELYLGGEGLARGYLNRPELTEQRFVPDPFSAEPGARLYRTGDLCRWRQDGTLEYLGRIDHQVKIRGFRIELGEIESALAQHPAVGEAVVVAREDSPGDKRLAAYLVARGGSLPAWGELRRHLQTKLPEYMIPAAFVELPALPLLPNGKVNRRALPAPDGQRPEQEQPFAAPRTPMEEALAGLWAEVLGIERVGVFDDFFSLGGHSLLATQMVAQLRPLFGVEVPLRLVFEARTIAQLATIIEGLTDPSDMEEVDL